MKWLAMDVNSINSPVFQEVFDFTQQPPLKRIILSEINGMFLYFSFFLVPKSIFVFRANISKWAAYVNIRSLLSDLPNVKTISTKFGNFTGRVVTIIVREPCPVTIRTGAMSSATVKTESTTAIQRPPIGLKLLAKYDKHCNSVRHGKCKTEPTAAIQRPPIMSMGSSNSEPKASLSAI
jgi:hypothetical protein